VIGKCEVKIMDTFSDNMLSRLKPGKKAFKVQDSGCPGLSLEVLPSGLKKWRLRRDIGGRRRQVTLGALPGLTLAQARRLAGLGGGAKGLEAFGKLADLWLSAMGPLAPKLAANLLERAILPALGAMAPAKITSSDILLKIIRPLVEAGDIEGAKRAGRLCQSLFLFGEAAGLVFGNPADGLPEPQGSAITCRITPVIDPSQASPCAPQGQPPEAKPHHYHVKRNPMLAGLPFDPSRQGAGGE
jgi:hypothetical protein